MLLSANRCLPPFVKLFSVMQHLPHIGILDESRILAVSSTSE